MNQPQVVSELAKALSQRPNDKKAAIKAVRKIVLTTLVKRAGLLTLLIVGIKAAANTKLPMEKTKSCQFIF